MTLPPPARRHRGAAPANAAPAAPPPRDGATGGDSIAVHGTGGVLANGVALEIRTRGQRAFSWIRQVR